MSNVVQSVKDRDFMLAGIAHADKKTKHGRHMTYHTDPPERRAAGENILPGVLSSAVS